MKHRYDAAAELAMVFIKYVPIVMFWMTVFFGFLLGTDELQRNWAIVLHSFFLMSFTAVAGTTFVHRLGIQHKNRKIKDVEVSRWVIECNHAQVGDQVSATTCGKPSLRGVEDVKIRWRDIR